MRRSSCRSGGPCALVTSYLMPNVLVEPPGRDAPVMCLGGWTSLDFPLPNKVCLHDPCYLPGQSYLTMAPEPHAPSPSLDLLEARLQRIQYALNGDNEIEETSTTNPPAEHTAAIRLRNLERQMRLIESKSPAAEEILNLQSKHPEIFNQVTDAGQSNFLPLNSQAALVLSHAQLYSRVSGQLQSLQETSVPDSAPASQLLELRPRVDKAATRQEQQAKELAELRSRSAAAVERWYETGVLGIAERWAEWEERMRDVEIVVRRLEAVKKREEELV